MKSKLRSLFIILLCLTLTVDAEAGLKKFLKKVAKATVQVAALPVTLPVALARDPVGTVKEAKNEATKVLKGAEQVVRDIRDGVKTAFSELKSALKLFKLAYNMLTGKRAELVHQKEQIEKLDERNDADAAEISKLLSEISALKLEDFVVMGASRAFLTGVDGSRKKNQLDKFWSTSLVNHTAVINAILPAYAVPLNLANESFKTCLLANGKDRWLVATEADDDIFEECIASAYLKTQLTEAELNARNAVIVQDEVKSRYYRAYNCAIVKTIEQNDDTSDCSNKDVFMSSIIDKKDLTVGRLKTELQTILASLEGDRKIIKTALMNVDASIQELDKVILENKDKVELLQKEVDSQEPEAGK